MNIKFFVRKKFPGYFSIEQIFLAVCINIKQHLPANANCEMQEVPYFFSAINFFRNIFFVNKHQTVINHITGDIHYAILGCSSKNLNVLTIHDCVLLERYPKWDIRYWIFRILWYELPMLKADLVTVISQKTKNDLLNKIRSGRKKIRVVSNFVNPVFRYSPKKFDKETPGLLFIGSTENKNLDRILQAVTGLSCNLQIVGKISDDQKLFIRNNKIRAELSFELSLDELVEKYKSADIVLFPSLYEGFGMLIIEANAVGTPVITSNFSPMLEVAGNAAVFVDPYSTDSIRQGILSVIENDDLRESIIKNGLLNAEVYSLDKAAETYLSLYKEFL